VTDVDSTLRPGLVGARIKRREDPRLLQGRGTYVDDVVRPAMLQAAFLRSPHPHAEVVSVDTTYAAELPGVHAVLTAADLEGHCEPIVADLEVSGWQHSEWFPLARGRVRYVGEAVVMVIADDRYVAEDALEYVDVVYEPLPVVASVADALAPDAPMLHDGWTSNAFVERSFHGGDPDEAFREAAGTVELKLRMNRSSAIPLECRGCVAEFAAGEGELTLWTSTQIPGLLRTGLADFLTVPEHRIRVISPDVGGGFGVKGELYPEEIAVCVASQLVRRPVKWIEDRQEHLLACSHAREQEHTIEVAYSADGEVLGMRAEMVSDCGAYSHWPWTSTREGAMAMSVLPGPYKIRNYEARALSVATNKCFFGAYRGVARPAGCFTIERAMDEVAFALGMDPLEVRRRNYVQPEEFPYTSITGLIYDSGSYTAALERVAEIADYDGLRRRQEAARAEGRYLGIGFASYMEQTASGLQSRARRGSPIISAFESALVRMDPSGFVTVWLSTHSHGQGHETSMAQIVGQELGLPLEQIRVLDGDTASTPYGHGTFASRSAVMAGGAAMRCARELADQLRQVAAENLEVDADDVELQDGVAAVKGNPQRAIPVSELARWVYHRPDRLPAGMPARLEAVDTYGGDPGPGTYANAAHMVLLEVDLETGKLDLLDYWVAEDCGQMINPLIVDGQVHGGVAQGIGGALMEEVIYDESGQLTTTTFKDYRLVGSTDMPRVHVSHLETKSPFTRMGIKGVGEGGTIAPNAALTSAVTDALAPLGHVFVNEVPLTPERVLRFVAQARSATAGTPGHSR
jgi:carbon-monoxide dehydrogenase large subunit